MRGVFLQVCCLSMTRPQKIMIFRQISFQPGPCMLKQALFSLKTWNKHESRKISRIGTFNAHFLLLLRWFTGAEQPTENRHIIPLFSWHRTRVIKLGAWWRCIYQHYLPRNPIEAAIPKDSVVIWLCHRTQLWYRMATYAVFVLRVVAIGRDGNAVLVLRWVAVCINDCFAATGHALDEDVECVWGQRAPTFL